MALLLGACDAAIEEPTAAPATIAGPSRPAVTIALPVATDTLGDDQPSAVATEVTLPSPTTPQATPLQSELGLPAGTSIALHQTGGFAGVDNWWIYYSDGLINTPASEQASVAPEEVAGQLAALDAAGFFEMTQPDSKPICCDHFTYTLYAHDGDRENLITISGGDADLSSELAAIIQVLQTLPVSTENT